MIKNNKVYDVLKWIALVGLDAIGKAYSELATIWDLPFGDKVYDTCVVISILIGTIVGISSVRYNKNNQINTLEEEDE